MGLAFSFPTRFFREIKKNIIHLTCSHLYEVMQYVGLGGVCVCERERRKGGGAFVEAQNSGSEISDHLLSVLCVAGQAYDSVQ